MRLLVFFALNFNLLFAYSLHPEKALESDKNSHAVLPGDIAKAFCQPQIDEALTKNDIYMKLRGKGHDLGLYRGDSRFKLEHFQNIYKAVLLMPDWLKLGRRNSAPRITYKIDTSRDAVASYKKSTIYINPLRWHKFEPDMRVSILFHELAHALGEVIFNIDDSKLWENVDGGWTPRKRRRDGSIWTGNAHNSDNFISDYAMVNPAEDFAESISAYRVKPLELYNTSPKRYKLIREVVYFNQQFYDDSNCAPVADDLINTEKVKQYLVNKLNSSSHYYDRAYRALSSVRGIKRHPTAMERLMLEKTVSILISKLGAHRDTSKDDYRFKHVLRVFLKNNDDLSFLKNAKASVLIRKLENDKRITY